VNRSANRDWQARMPMFRRGALLSLQEKSIGYRCEPMGAENSDRVAQRTCVRQCAFGFILFVASDFKPVCLFR